MKMCTIGTEMKTKNRTWLGSAENGSARLTMGGCEKGRHLVDRGADVTLLHRLSFLFLPTYFSLSMTET